KVSSIASSPSASMSYCSSLGSVAHSPNVFRSASGLASASCPPMAGRPWFCVGVFDIPLIQTNGCFHEKTKSLYILVERPTYTSLSTVGSSFVDFARDCALCLLLRFASSPSILRLIETLHVPTITHVLIIVEMPSPYRLRA